jgi:hypothetical protein
MIEARCFMQLIHPGGEHQPEDGAAKEWNRGDHARKFLKSPGRFRGSPGSPERHGEIVFWGELEPESRVVARYSAGDQDSPRFLYEPFYLRHDPRSIRQNTDPFVFGDQFHYTGCLQHTQQRPHPAPVPAARIGDPVRLMPGQIPLRHRHRLRGRQPHRPLRDRLPAGRERPGIRCLPRCDAHAVVRRLTATVAKPPALLRRHAREPGRRHVQLLPVPADRCCRFRLRPPDITIPGRITPTLLQGKKITRSLSIDEVRKLW